MFGLTRQRFGPTTILNSVLTWLLIVCLWASAVQPMAFGAEPTEEAFFVGAISQLKFLGEKPEQQRVLEWNTGRRRIVWTDEAESTVFDSREFRGNRHDWNTFDGYCVAIRGQKGQVVRGTLRMGPNLQQEKTYRFEVKLTATDDHSRSGFWEAWISEYRSLLGDGGPGGAWHRHQMRRGYEALNRKMPTQGRRNRQFFGSRLTSAEDTLALMSGGRAVSENLQLDREIPIRGADGAAVKLETLPGITVREFDWGPMVQGLAPEKDALVTMIPSDQHVLFVPSFQALVELVDSAKKHGTPLVNLASPQSEDAMSQERYERQLCLSLGKAARWVGGSLIKSVAMTGGDAYFRTGTDVAVVMETGSAEALRKLIRAQQTLAATQHEDAANLSGEVLGVPYVGVRTPSREVCSYVATVKDRVVVTNSLVQLGIIIETATGKRDSINELQEYTFFRDRYAKSQPESALLILTDATIRRWCSPKWRIAASRRTRVAAAMADIQSDHLSGLVNGDIKVKQVTTQLGVARGEGFTLSASQIRSDAYGNLDFQTPISELDLTAVSSEEARMYRRWRDGYQRSWSNYFDPIAIRLIVEDKQLEADITVMPLIAQSSYRELRNISMGSKLNEGVGDPHPEALLQWMLALNPDSPQLKGYTNLLRGFAPQIRVDPMSWLGKGISLYVDRDAFWQQARDAENLENFVESNIDRLPIALHLEVRDGLRLALFMTGLRAFVEQTVPGMTVWESKKHEGEPYVEISATDRVGVRNANRFALFYAASGEGLTFSLNESLIHRALKRRVARREAKKEGAKPEAIAKATELNLPWQDQNVAFRVSKEGLQVVEEVLGTGYESQMRRMSYANIPILNEWKRLFPELDPTEVHENFWQRKLICPGGGKYVWNDELKTMESTVYGSPVAQKEGGPKFPKALQVFEGGSFGLEFEKDGLRGRVKIQRE